MIPCTEGTTGAVTNVTLDKEGRTVIMKTAPEEPKHEEIPVDAFDNDYADYGEYWEDECSNPDCPCHEFV